MEKLTLLCVFFVAITGLTSGAGVLPDSVNAAVGGSVMFTTTIPPTSTPFIAITWSFGTKNITTSTSKINNTAPDYRDRITLFISTGSLELRNLALSDAGEYSVGIVPAGSSSMNGQTILNVYVPVSVTVTVNDTDLVELNDSVSLSCSASGSPPFSFLWLNHSSGLTDNDRLHLTVTDGGFTLTIVRVTRYDQGPFTCNVSNAVSSNISEVYLNISYGPDDVTVKVLPSHEYYAEGSVVSLSCSADSRPEAEFRWFLNGHILSVTGAQLSLENLQMDQSGSYSCQAFNTKTLRYTTSQPALINVLKNITNAVISSSPDRPVEGTSVNLTCDASGSISSREWRKNGLTLKPSENTVFYEENTVLSFINLSRTDSGRYSCDISNPVSSQEATYDMNVNYGPEHVQISGPNKVQVETLLKLSCSSDSVPAATYLWIKDGTTVSHSSEYSKDKSQNSDSGEYICKATNEITMKTSEASHTVTVQETPVNNSNGCSTGCIVGIVVGCIIVIGLAVFGGVFYVLRKRKPKEKPSPRSAGEGQDNSANGQNQEVNYADVRFMKKEGGVVQLGVQNNVDYAQVRKNNNPPASNIPTYASVQKVKQPAPQPIQTETEYSEIRRN